MPSNIELKAQEILEKEEKVLGILIPINRLIKKLPLNSDYPEDVLRRELLPAKSFPIEKMINQALYAQL